MTKKTAGSGEKAKDEAERIYRAIFRAPMPPEIRERYDRALSTLFSVSPREEDGTLSGSVLYTDDLEALELAARRQNKRPRLIARFQLMVHLAETIPANQPIFINSSDRRIRSYVSLMLGGVRTLCKYLKGRFFLRGAGDV